MYINSYTILVRLLILIDILYAMRMSSSHGMAPYMQDTKLHCSLYNGVLAYYLPFQNKICILGLDIPLYSIDYDETTFRVAS